MISIQRRSDLEDMRLGIGNRGHVVLPGFLSRDEAARLESAMARRSFERMYATIESAKFDGVDLEPGDELHDLFKSELLVSTMRAVLGLPEGAPLQRLSGWINRYKVGECIPAHKDAGGSIQLLISLHHPPPENGGTLFVEDESERQPVFLETGDAVLFLATKLTHHSEVLVATPEHPEPTKMVAVGRYYF